MAQEEENIKLTFDTNAKNAAQDVNKLSASIESSTDATNENNQAVKSGNEGYKSFKAQLREANQELQKQIQLTGESSEETIIAAKSVAELKDQMGFAKDISNTFNPDQKFKALGAATQIAATGISGVTAGMALFGDQSEDTQKVLLKVQAAMAFSESISSLSNLGDQFKIFESVVKSTYVKIIAAKEADIVVTGQATIAQRLLNLVARANPYVLLASAVAAVTIATVAWYNSSKNAAAATEKANREINKIENSLQSLDESFKNSNAELNSRINNTLAMAKASGASSDAIRRKTLSLSEEEQAEKKLNAEKAKSLLIEAERIYLTSKVDEETKEVLKKKTQEALAFFIEQNNIYRDSLKKARQIIVDGEIEIQQEQTDARNAAEEKAKEKREEQAERDKELLEEKKKKDAEFLAEFNKFQADQFTFEQEEKARQREEILRANEEFDLQVAANEQKEFERHEAIEMAKLALTVSIEESKRNILEKGIGLIKNLFGKNKEVQKAALIAESAIGIAQTVQKAATADAAALAQGIIVAGPIAGPAIATPARILNAVSSGLNIATNVAATAKALQALGGGSAPSANTSTGFNGGSGSVAAQASPTVAFNNTAENQIGKSISNAQAEQPPIKVFVAESDITESQGYVKALVDKNKI